MPEPFVIAPAEADPQPPRWGGLAGGWDCHAHVFGPVARHAFPPDPPYVSPDQPVDHYIAMLDVMGLSYGVLVQPSVYGADHGCLIEALAAHPDRLTGVIDLNPLTLSDGETERLRRVQVTGIRLRWPAPGGAAYLGELCRHLRDVGWHLDLLPADLDAMASLAASLPPNAPPLIIEAMGNPRAGQPLNHSGFAALCRLLEDERAYVKLSHSYHVDPAGLPYAGAAPFARTLVEAAPKRCVWGSDWPHPMRNGPMPRDGQLLDLLFAWAGGEEAAAAILTTNPQTFYAGQRIIE